MRGLIEFILGKLTEYLELRNARIIEKKACKSCDNLLHLLEVEKAEKRELLQLLSKISSPKVEDEEDEEPKEYKPVPKALTWRQQRYALEQEAIERARKLKTEMTNAQAK